jgi:glutathione S-transferase
MCELGIPYEIKAIGFAEVKQEPFLSLNPNGRMPAIEDPNTGLVLWESGAIIDYLIENYDKEHKLTYDTFPEKYQQDSWKYFQVSGQGPYFGQYVWFGNVSGSKLSTILLY